MPVTAIKIERHCEAGMAIGLTKNMDFAVNHDDEHVRGARYFYAPKNVPMSKRLSLCELDADGRVQIANK